MLTEKEQITIATYDLIAPNWVPTHMDPNMCREEFDMFRGYLPAGEILEIGVGGGRDARRIVNAGYGYVGIDISDGVLREARKNNPDLVFIKEDIYDLRLPIQYDGLWSAATLLHIPKRRIFEALDSVHNFIRKDGIGFVCVKEGYGDMVPEEEEIDGEKVVRYFSYYQKNEFAQILEFSRFPVLNTTRKQISPKTTWLNYFIKAKK